MLKDGTFNADISNDIWVRVNSASEKIHFLCCESDPNCIDNWIPSYTIEQITEFINIIERFENATESQTYTDPYWSEVPQRTFSVVNVPTQLDGEEVYNQKFGVVSACSRDWSQVREVIMNHSQLVNIKETLRRAVEVASSNRIVEQQLIDQLLSSQCKF